MFYQYHPYDAHWGPMHWGHAVSEDLLHWEFLPVALAPDEFYDKDGVFSGSAITLEDGRHLLIYTGVMKRTTENGQMKEFQTQCVAIGDGLDYEKYENNPVINSDAIPKDSSKTDFRDPKIWQKEDGSFIPPPAFIPLAEETGLVTRIDMFVLYTACRQIKAWKERHR